MTSHLWWNLFSPTSLNLCSPKYEAIYWALTHCTTFVRLINFSSMLTFSFQIYFPAYSQVAEICNSKENDEQTRIRNSLQLLCLLLPCENRTVLEHLIDLLHKASKMESHNKMTADTLATLFTPHLICPRKLQPEVLHHTAATMTRMISFMITCGSKIFLVPEKLSTDVRAYFVDQKRRRETPEKVLDESISDSVANTVFTFVDREKTAEAHVSNSTDTALAQLYAHIQTLPESSKKKKLIKQFNKQNGQGECRISTALPWHHANVA